MKKFRVTVILEGGKLKEPLEDVVEVEAENVSPGATTAAMNIVFKKHSGKGYRYRFGDINELQD